MNDFNPSWHATNDEASSSSPKSSDVRFATRIPVSNNVTVSRLPAALLGIFVVILGGVFYARGIPNLRGDVISGTDIQSTSIAIHLTSSGASPSQVHVQPGQTITWINDRTSPEIIQSDTIKDASGATLYTPLIQPGKSSDFVVSPSQESGAFNFNSLMSKSASGTIVVDAQAVPLAATIPPFSSSASSINVLSGNDVGSGNVIPAVPSQSAKIPHNPFTVTNGYERPLAALSQSSKGFPTSLHAGAPLRPAEQPKSGPELWVCFLLSAFTMTWFMGRSHIGVTA